jgi:hypothetical protein
MLAESSSQIDPKRSFARARATTERTSHHSPGDEKVDCRRPSQIRHHAHEAFVLVILMMTVE